MANIDLDFTNSSSYATSPDMFVIISPSVVLVAVATASLGAYLYQRLVYLRWRQYAHLPQPCQASLLWGHLRFMGEADAAVNKSRWSDASDEMWLNIFRDAGNPEVLLADFRPLMMPLLVVQSHAVAEQISRQSKVMPYGAPKKYMLDYLEPLVGKHSIIKANGHEWKDLRRRFNPGFAPQHLLSLMPVITDKCKGLLAKLDDSARTGEICTLGPLFIDLTFDIIGAVTAGIEFRAQGTPEEQHPIVSTYVQLLETYSHHSGTLPWWAEPHVRWRRRGLQRKVDGYLHDHVVEEFRKFKAGGEAGRDVLSLSFHDLDELTPDIIDETADQIKSFLFAGHDTTSKILQWAVFEISRHPRVLEAVRAEVDAALGTDPDPLSVLQGFNTHADDIFRALPYTAAVFRETLRRHTTAGTGRYIPTGSGLNITLRDGSSLCLDGVTVFLCHDLIMLDEEVYGPTTWDFVPERWVTDEQAQVAMARARTDEERRVIREARATEVPASSFRPFERGPRNCIGQELSLIEGCIILALLIRQYDFAKVDVGAATLGEDGKPLVDAKGRHISETEPWGIRKGTSGPMDGIKIKVSFREGFER